MGLMRKLLWDASPGVILAKKVRKAQKNKIAAQSGMTREQLEIHEAEAQATKQAIKERKKLSIGGVYNSSHPDIHGQDFLSIQCGEDGVYVVGKKNSVVKVFGWNEIIGFDKKIEDKSQVSTNQRVTMTRMAAVGVFAIAAPKKTKSGNVRNDFFYSLRTTTGDIDIEQTIDSGDAPGSIGDFSRNATQLYINQQTAKANNIKRYILEHVHDYKTRSEHAA